jgi:hypothetical protein
MNGGGGDVMLEVEAPEYTIKNPRPVEVGDVVVFLNGSPTDWMPPHSYERNSIGEIADIYYETPELVAVKRVSIKLDDPARIIISFFHDNEESMLFRFATEEEQFLYYVRGSNAIIEEDNKIKQNVQAW